MKPIVIAWWVGVAACAPAGPQHVFTPVGGYAQDASLGSGTGAIEGVVVDKGDGKPLSGATVVLGPSHGREQVVITDDHGDFRVVLEPGTYSLTVYAVDLAPYSRKQVVLRAGGILRVKIQFDVSGAEQEERRHPETIL